MLNFGLKLVGLLVFGLFLQKAISFCFHERQQNDAKHILWGVGCLFSIACLGLPGEYAFKHSLMTPVLHILYDAIIDGLLLGAIYHGFAFTVEITAKEKKNLRNARRYLILAWMLLGFFHAIYRFGLPVFFFGIYYLLRVAIIIYYVGKVIYWFHQASKEADTYHTKYQMVLLKYACLISILYPFSIFPQSEIIEPRPNLIIAISVGTLLYLGYAMPRWFEQVLLRFELNPRLLEQNLWLVSLISEYYNQITPVSPTRFEYILRGFCHFLSQKKSQIDLIVKASYLRNVGELYSKEADDQLLLKISDKMVRIDLQMSRNVSLSAHVAKEILHFSKMAEILWHLCERWDGLGYPDELKGKEIPYESRLLAMVDFFVRVQQENGEKQALSMLTKEAGNRFDPNLVEKFHAFWQKRLINL